MNIAIHANTIRWAVATVAILSNCNLAQSQNATTQTPSLLIEPAAATSTHSGPTPRQVAYLAATPEMRVSYIEAIGEEGARQFARRLGWQPICDGLTARQIVGFDQVYVDADGVVHVVEAKGGGSSLGRGYGYRQGTPEWAVSAAERTILNPKATTLEREAARRIIEAAKSGKLSVHVIRTPHVLGEPGVTALEQSRACSGHARKLAESATKRLASAGIEVSRPAGSAPQAGQVRPSAIRFPGHTLEVPMRGGAPVRSGTLPPGTVSMRPASPTKPMTTTAMPRSLVSGALLGVGLALDGAMRVSDSAEIERQYKSGNIDFVQRRIAHARNWGGMAGGWAAASGGAWAGAKGGAAVGTAICPGPGTAIGTFLGGLAGGAGGYIVGDHVAGDVAGSVAEYVGQPIPGLTLPRFD